MLRSLVVGDVQIDRVRRVGEQKEAKSQRPLWRRLVSTLSRRAESRSIGAGKSSRAHARVAVHFAIKTVKHAEKSVLEASCPD